LKKRNFCFLAEISGFLRLRPFLAGFRAFPLFFYGWLFIEASRLDLFEKALDLDFSLESLDGFLDIIADNSYLYNRLSPFSLI